MLNFGIGSLFGSIGAAVFSEFYTPFTGYLFGALVTFFIMIFSFAIDDDIETNQYAQEAYAIAE